MGICEAMVIADILNSLGDRCVIPTLHIGIGWNAKYETSNRFPRCARFNVNSRNAGVVEEGVTHEMLRGRKSIMTNYLDEAEFIKRRELLRGV